MTEVPQSKCTIHWLPDDMLQIIADRVLETTPSFLCVSRRFNACYKRALSMKEERFIIDVSDMLREERENTLSYNLYMMTTSSCFGDKYNTEYDKHFDKACDILSPLVTQGFLAQWLDRKTCRNHIFFPDISKEDLFTRKEESDKEPPNITILKDRICSTFGNNIPSLQHRDWLVLQMAELDKCMKRLARSSKLRANPALIQEARNMRKLRNVKLFLQHVGELSKKKRLVSEVASSYIVVDSILKYFFVQPQIAWDYASPSALKSALGTSNLTKLFPKLLLGDDEFGSARIDYYVFMLGTVMEREMSMSRGTRLQECLESAIEKRKGAQDLGVELMKDQQALSIMVNCLQDDSLIRHVKNFGWLEYLKDYSASSLTNMEIRGIVRYFEAKGKPFEFNKDTMMSLFCCLNQAGKVPETVIDRELDMTQVVLSQELIEGSFSSTREQRKKITISAKGMIRLQLIGSWRILETMYELARNKDKYEVILVDEYQSTPNMEMLFYSSKGEPRWILPRAKEYIAVKTNQLINTLRPQCIFYSNLENRLEWYMKQIYLVTLNIEGIKGQVMKELAIYACKLNNPKVYKKCFKLGITKQMIRDVMSLVAGCYLDSQLQWKCIRDIEFVLRHLK